MVTSIAGAAAGGDEKAVHALVRLANRAYGTTPVAPPEEGDAAQSWEGMSRAERSMHAARLLQEAEEIESAAATAGGYPRKG